MDAVPEVELVKKVNFAWINESFDLFKLDVPIWLLVELLYVLCVLALSVALSVVLHQSSIITVFQAAFSHRAPSSEPFNRSPLATVTTTAVFLLFKAYFSVVTFSIANKVVRDERLNVADLVRNLRLYPRFLLVCSLLEIPQLIYALGVNPQPRTMSAVGYILGCACALSVIDLIFGPIVWLGLALLADGRDIKDAISGAFVAVKNSWMRAIWFTFVMSMLWVVSACACGLGLLVTTPMTYIIGSLAYRDMVGMPRAPRFKPEVIDDSSWPPRPTG